MFSLEQEFMKYKLYNMSLITIFNYIIIFMVVFMVVLTIVNIIYNIIMKIIKFVSFILIIFIFSLNILMFIKDIKIYG
jgi:hypothetical protein